MTREQLIRNRAAQEPASQEAVPTGWPKYTSKMGQAGDDYINRLGGRSPMLPALFRWEECFAAMLAASPAAPSVTQSLTDEQIDSALGDHDAALNNEQRAAVHAAIRALTASEGEQQ